MKRAFTSTVSVFVLISGAVAIMGQPFSEDFTDATLNPGWVFESPNAGSSMLLNGTTLNITAAWANGGSDLYNQTDYNAPRLLQAIDTNSSWLVEVKFDFSAANNYCGAGILLAETNGVFTTPSQFNRIAERYSSPGEYIGPISGAVADSAPTTYFRLQKLGVNYTEWWSSDGTTWNYGGTETMTTPWPYLGIHVLRQPWDNVQVNTSVNFYYFHVTPLSLPPHTYTWTGTASSDWFNTNNWYPVGVPGGADTVIINSGTATISAPTNVGSITFNGGTLNAGPNLIVSNAFNWTNGSVAGTVVIPSAGTINFASNAGTLYLANGAIVNNGTANWAGGTIQGNGASVITNNGTWLDQTDNQINDSSGGNWTFYNNGTFTKSPTTGTATFAGVAYNNAGSTTIQSGFLKLDGGGYLTSAFVTTNGTAVYFDSGTFSYGAGLSLAGTGSSALTGNGALTLSNIIPNLQLNGGTLYLAPNFQNGSITNLTLTGSTLAGSNTVAGTLTVLAGGLAGVLHIDNGGALYVSGSVDMTQTATVTNAGHIVWNGSGNWNLRDDNGQTHGWIVNLPTGIFDILCNQQINNAYGNETFTNAGLVRKMQEAGTTTVYAAFGNSGTVSVLAGTLNFQGGYFGGTFTIANGAAANFQSGGVFAGAFNVGFQSVLNLTGGSFTELPSVSFSGAGVSEITGGSLTLLAEPPANFQLNGGTISLSPTFQGGAIQNFTVNNQTITGSNYVTGTFTINSSTLNGPLYIAPGAVVNWTSGQLSGPVTIADGGTLNILAPGGHSFANSVMNAGSVNWTGGEMRLLYNNNFYNQASGAFNIQCDQSFDDYYGDETFYNNGLVVKSTTIGNTSFNPQIDNAGSVNINSGEISFYNNAPSQLLGGSFAVASGAALSFNGGGFLTGTYNAAAGATTYLSGGTFTNTPTTVFTGAGSSLMTGGTITLISNLIPNLQINAGSVALSSAFQQNGDITNLTLSANLIGSNRVLGVLNLTGDLDGPLTVASNATVSWSGNANYPLILTPTATANWSGGTMSSSPFIPTNAVLNLVGGGSHAFATLITNAGTINWSNSETRLLYNNSLYNLAGATFNIYCDQSFDDYYGGEVIYNYGLITKNLTSGNTSVNPILDNFGSVVVNSGAINFYNNAPSQLLGGTFSVAPGAAINFNGGGVLSGTYTAAAGGNFYLTGGIFTNTLTTVFNGAGSSAMSGGTLTLVSNLIPNLQITGGTAGFSSAFQGNGAITNLTLNANITGSNYLAGTLNLTGDIDGPLTLASNSVLNWTGNLNAALTIMPSSVINWGGGTLNSSTLIPSNGVLNLIGSGGHAFAAAITNGGTINWSNGEVRLFYNNNFYNLAGATFNILCDQTWDNYYGQEAFYNSGLLLKTNTAGVTTFNPIFHNPGVADVESGNIHFNNTTDPSTGVLEFGLDGPANNGSISVGGTFNFSGGLSVHANDYVLGLSNQFSLVYYNSSSGLLVSTNLPNLGASWQLSYGPGALTLEDTNLNIPSVSILTPANNAVFILPGAVPLTASVTDPYASVTSVQYFAGTNFLGQAASSPYSVSWNASPGYYTLSAMAIDAHGGMATSAPVSVSVFSSAHHATNFTWTGAVSTDWGTAANWTPNGVPSALDTVFISSGTVSLAAADSVSAVNFSGGTLQGAGVLTVTNAFNWAGGNLNGALTIGPNAAFNISPAQGNNINGLILNNNGAATWTSSDLNGNAGAAITNNGLWVIATDNSINLSGGSFVNNGTFRKSGRTGGTSLYNLAFSNNGAVDGERGTIYFQSGGTLAGSYNAAANAAVMFSSGTFTLSNPPPFTGSGYFGFQGGQLNAALTIPSVLTLTGGSVALGPQFQKAGVITNLTLSGATLQGTNAVSGAMNWTGGAIAGQLTIAPSGVLNWTSGNSKSLNSSAIINNGQINWQQGSIGGDSASSLTNNGLVLVTTDDTIGFNNGASILVNNGVFRKTAYTGRTYIRSMTVTNNGTFDAESGSIYFEAGGALSGTYNAAAGAEVAFDGGSFLTGYPVSLTGAGEVALTSGNMLLATNVPPGLQFVGGTLSLSPAFQSGGVITNLTLAGSTLSGNYVVAQTMTFQSGTLNGSLTVSPSATLYITPGNHTLTSCQLTNLGNVYWSGGTISPDASSAIVNTGFWLAQSDDQINNSGLFDNSGTFRKLGTSGTTTLNIPFNNTGTVDAESGAIAFQDGGSLSGIYNAANFTGIYFAGGSYTANLNPVITGVGTFQFNSGNLTLAHDQIANLPLLGGNIVLASTFQQNGAITNFTLSGSTLLGSNVLAGTFNWNAGGFNSSQLYIATNGTLNILTAADKNMPGSTIVNNGTVLWNGGRLRGGSGTAITNNSIWLVQCDYQLNNDYCCAPSFVNAGTLEKSSTFGSTTFNNWSLLNMGTISIQSGIINFANSGSFAQTSGTLAFGISSADLIGQLSVPNPLNIDGDLQVQFLNGYSPSLQDSYPLITYPSASGQFSVLDLPTLSAGQSWNLSYGASDLNLSVASTPASIGNHAISGSVTDTQSHPIAGLVVTATPAPGSITNLIQNGSFEMPSIGATPYVLYSSGATNITGWTVTGPSAANVALTSRYWGGPAEDGAQFLDPSGNTGLAGVEQTFLTTPGVPYDLVFFHGTYSHHGIDAVLGVTIGTNYFTIGETQGNGFDWRRVEMPFTASSNQTTLAFTELTGFDANDSFIDNVQVIPSDYFDSVLEAVTDSSGHYSIPAPNGSYQVDVGGLGAAGYQDVSSQLATINNANATANFVAQPLATAQFFTINTTVSPANAGNATGGGSFLTGSTITINAVETNVTLPYSFVNWTENGVVLSSSASFTFTVLRNQNLVANFTLPTEVLIGTVSPANAGSVLGGGTFSYGSTNTLSASADFGYRFDHWSDQNGDVLGTIAALKVVALSNGVYVANYTGTNLVHFVTTGTIPLSLTAVSGAGTYNNGQTAAVAAPPFVTNGLTYYLFSQYLLNGDSFTNAASFNWTFSTTDVTNFNLTALYAARSVLPLVTAVQPSIPNPVKATSNFALTIQFDRAMQPSTLPLVALTNHATGALQPSVPPSGAWSTNVFPNNTYTTPPISFVHGMDGTNYVLVSQAIDLHGDAIVPTNVLAVIVDATPPAITDVTVTPGAISAIINWNTSEPATSEVYYGPTPAYANNTGFDSRLLTSHSETLTGLAPLSAFHYQIQSRDQAGNETDLPDATFSTIAAPDLQVTNLTASPSLVSGGNATISWVVTNSGSGPTFSVWYDRVTVSNLTAHQTIFSKDVYFDPSVSGNISGGGAVARSVGFTLPNGATGAGALAITVVANVYSNQFELTTANNSASISATSTLNVYPDLQVAHLSVSPHSLQSGNTMTIAWNDTNSGSGAVSASFYDQVVVTNLSTGVVLYNSSVLYDVSVSGSIPANHAATRQTFFTLPNGPTGVGTLGIGILADANNNIFEYNTAGTAESNNTNSLTVISTLAAYPDLVVTNITIPSTVNAGQPFTASWVDTNKGAAAAGKPWTEQVLLSTDGTTNTSQLIASYTYSAGLAPAQSVTNTQTITLPSFVSGNQWLVVRVDPLNEVFVLDHSNNVAVSSHPIQIVSTLALKVNPTSFDKNAANPAASGTVTRYGASGSALSVALSSDNPSAAIVPPFVTIPAGQTSANFPVNAVNTNIYEGTRQADIVAAASGYPNVTNELTVTDSSSPTLVVTSLSNYCNVSSTAPIPCSVARNTSTAAALTVNIVVDSTQFSAPTTVTIPVGAASASFNVQTVNAHLPRAPHAATVSAASAGYSGQSASITIIDDDAPALSLAFADPTISKGAVNPATHGTITASLVTTQAISIFLQTPSSAISIPSTVTLPANQTSVTFPVNAVEDHLVTGDQTALVIAQLQDIFNAAPLVSGAASASIKVTDDNGPALSVSLASSFIAENGSTTGTVTRNTLATNALAVSLASSLPTGASVPASVTIPLGQTSKTFPVTGVNPGVPTGTRHADITASATGYGSGVAGLDVSDINIPDLAVTGITVPSNGQTESAVTISYTVANQGLASTTNIWHDAIYYSASPDGSNPQLLTETLEDTPLAVEHSYTNTVQITLPTTPGLEYIVVTANANAEVYEGNYVNNTATSELPITNSPSYHAIIQADLTTALTPTPVPMHGYAYNTTNPSQRVPNVQVVIGVSVKGTVRTYNTITDGNGNFTNIFYPIPGEAGQYGLQADYPGVQNPTVQSSFNLIGASFTDNLETYRLYPDTNITGQTTLLNSSDVPLTGIKARAVGFPASVNVAINVPDEIDSDDMVPLSYSLFASNITTATSFQGYINVSSDQGATASLPFNVTLSPETPVLICNPTYLQSSMLIGAQTFVDFDIQNIGGAPSGPINLQLPGAPWMGAASVTNIPSLAPGASNRFIISLTPDANFTLGLYQGNIVAAAPTTAVNVPFEFRAVSDAIGGLQVTVQDEFTFYAAGAPLVTNALVVLTDPITVETIASASTGQSGIVQFTNIDQGTYQMTVSAPQHSTYQSPVTINPGQLNQINAFVSRQTVSYTWVVVPTTIPDQYQVTLQAQFETEVPAPVVTIDNPLVTPVMFPGIPSEVQFQLSNHGLVAAQQITLDLPTDDTNFIYTPLVSSLDEIPAMTSISVPVLISWRTNSSNSRFVVKTAERQAAVTHQKKNNISSCTPIPKIDVKWTYVCGDDGHWQLASAEFLMTTIPLGCSPPPNLGGAIGALKTANSCLNKFGTLLTEIGDKEVNTGSVCDVVDCAEKCITDPCVLTILNTICGVATGNAKSALNNALHWGNCICPNIPSLTITTSDGGPGGPYPPPPPPGGGGGGGGGIGQAIWDPISIPWSFTIEGCTPGQTESFVNNLLSVRNPASSNSKTGISPTDTNTVQTTTAGDTCAHVTIQFQQQVALTRNAFQGTLTINNGDPSNPINNILVSLSFTDDNSNSVNNLFDVPPPVLSGLTAVDGTGVIAVGASGSAQYTIIPAHDAAPDAPVHYQVGGTLSYVQSSNTVTIPLASQDMYVYPDPVLDLDYFLQRDVIGDDPNAPGTITPQPFNLGLMVRNTGAGSAQNFTITSAQPTIVENSKGLLINFQILGTEVQTNAISPSLTANLGNLAPHSDTVAVWQLMCSLAGRFVSYSASFQHLNSLGDIQTSLIDNVNIHQMIHTFMSVRPGDDLIPDFLVNDIPNPNNYPDTVYLSDGTTNYVSVIAGAGTDAPIGPNHMQAVLTANMTSGWNYLEAADPGPGYKLYRAVRSDGLDMKVPYNIWSTPLSFPATQTGALHTNIVHLVDDNGTGSYTLYYHTTNTTPPAVIGLQAVTPFIQPGAISSLQITFSEPIDLTTFGLGAIILTKDGQNLGTNGLTITLVNNATYAIGGLAALTGNEGNYQLTVNAANVQDFGGNSMSGNPVASTAWSEGNAPLVVQSIDTITPNPRNTPVNSINVTFDKAVNASTFDYHAVSLTLNGGPNLSSSGLAISQLSSSSFQITGLAALTGAAGSYALSVDAALVQDSGGDAGVGSSSTSWTVITTGPTITSMPPPQTPRNIVILSQNVTFSEAIDPTTFTTNDLTLTLNGGPNLISGTVTISQLSPTTFQIQNFNWAIGNDGNYTLAVDATKVRDFAGNAGTGAASVNWQMSTHQPPPPSKLAVSPITGIYPSLTASNLLTLTGTVASNDLTVRVIDQTSGTDFGTASLIGTNFSAALNLPQGSNYIAVYAVDDAANVSTNAYITVVVDQTAIGANWGAAIATPRITPITNIDLAFDKPVDITSVHATNLTLLFNATNTLHPTFTMVSSNDWRVGGLAPLTMAQGSYQLSFNLNGVKDPAGNVASGSVTANWVNVANQLPTISQIGNVAVTPGQNLRLTFSDSDPLDLSLNLQLGSGAPAGLVLTNGVLDWTPACDQGGSSNYITLWAVENVASPLSNSMSFAILVRDCLQVDVGSAIVPAGSNGSLPLQILAAGNLTNLTFTLDFPTNRLINWSLNHTNPAVGPLAVQALNATQTVFTVSAATGQVITGLNTLGSLSFAVTPGSSAFVPLNVDTLGGFDVNNNSVAVAYSSGGRVIVLGPQPLLEAQVTNNARNVLLYGLPGNSYQLQNSSNLSSASNWLTIAIVPMTNYIFGLSNVSHTPADDFYRAYSFSAEPPMLRGSVTQRKLSLTAFGVAGGDYELQFTTNATAPYLWSPVLGYSLTNSFQALPSFDETNSMILYRLKKK